MDEQQTTGIKALDQIAATAREGGLSVEVTVKADEYGATYGVAVEYRVPVSLAGNALGLAYRMTRLTAFWTKAKTKGARAKLLTARMYLAGSHRDIRLVKRIISSAEYMAQEQAQMFRDYGPAEEQQAPVVEAAQPVQPDAMQGAASWSEAERRYTATGLLYVKAPYYVVSLALPSSGERPGREITVADAVERLANRGAWEGAVVDGFSCGVVRVTSRRGGVMWLRPVEEQQEERPTVEGDAVTFEHGGEEMHGSVLAAYRTRAGLDRVTVATPDGSVYALRAEAVSAAESAEEGAGAARVSVEASGTVEGWQAAVEALPSASRACREHVVLQVLDPEAVAYRRTVVTLRGSWGARDTLSRERLVRYLVDELGVAAARLEAAVEGGALRLERANGRRLLLEPMAAV